MVDKRFADKVGPLKIKRGILNYLSVTPLINGMRSLEQLVNRLQLEGDTVTAKPAVFKEEEIAMIVHGASEFENSTSVWWKLRMQNVTFGNILDKGKISETDDILIRAAAKT
jgi:hypothetical protein